MNFEAQNGSSSLDETIRATRRQVSRWLQTVLCFVAPLIFCISSIGLPTTNKILTNPNLVVGSTLYAHRFGNYIILNYPGQFTLQGCGNLVTWTNIIQATDAVTMLITDEVKTNYWEIDLASDYINPADGCVGFNLYVNGVLANTTTMDSQTINGHPTFGAIVPPGSYACCVTWFGTNGVESPYSQTVLASAKPVTSRTAQFWRAMTP